MLGRGKALDAGPDFAEEGAHRRALQPGDLGEIDAEDAVEFAAQVEARLVALGVPVAGRAGWQRRGGDIDARLELAQEGGELRVALGHHLLVMGIGGAGLAQGEEVFVYPVADEAFGDGGQVGLDAVVTQGGELVRVAFAGEERINDGQTGLAGQIANDVG